MIHRYLAMQQTHLEKLGQQTAELRNQAESEQRRAQQLQLLVKDMVGSRSEIHPLVIQNRQLMGEQLQRLFEYQLEQSAEANAELSRHEAALFAQFGKVKGLEKVLDLRQSQQDELQERRVQRELDELVCQRFLRQGVGPA